MKSVLISIKPKWCDLIESGDKTIEVRKTTPKIDTPFKCYIYETKGATEIPWMDEDGHMIFKGRGEVVGEFVCDAMIPMSIEYSDVNSHLALKEFPYTCLTDKQIMDYLGNGKQGYGWHISELKIYGKPKPLSEFELACLDKEDCFNCKRRSKNGFNCIAGITRPPQSWCYVDC